MPFTFDGPAGLLEGAVHGHTAQADRWMIVCHPHPEYGGSMHNNVVDAIVRAGVSTGYGVLTFNFRGVGESEGRSGGGAGEVDDLLAALCYLGDERNCLGDRVVLAGYSFGAVIAAQAFAAGVIPRAALWVAPPINVMPLAPEAIEWVGPKALLAGTNDTYCPAATAQALATDAGECMTCWIIDGADHFLVGYEAVIETRAGEFLRALPPPAG